MKRYLVVEDINFNNRVTHTFILEIVREDKKYYYTKDNFVHNIFDMTKLYKNKHEVRWDKFRNRRANDNSIASGYIFINVIDEIHKEKMLRKPNVWELD
jgi:hypothetical protein